MEEIRECIRKNILSVQERIIKAAQKAGRSTSDIQLIAVSKTHPASIIDLALTNGITAIGENKVQEAITKIPSLQQPYKELHFIGHLQSNKIAKLLQIKPFLIHSIDKLSTAQKLNQLLLSLNLQQNVLIEVNTSSEQSKSGITPSSTIDFIKAVALLPAIHIKGLMTISAITDKQEVIRSCFRKLRQLQEEISTLQIANVEMRYLSMGMSDDFEIAIEEGANLLRVGTAIFGARNYPNTEIISEGE